MPRAGLVRGEEAGLLRIVSSPIIQFGGPRCPRASVTGVGSAEIAALLLPVTGGIAGLILYGPLAHFLPLNYAVANTDMGTSPAATDPLGGRVLTGHPEKQIDYATRSTNLMTVRSKQIIRAFYGEPAKYSYFFGCSVGGGQALHEALQFPGDYDGIVAGRL